MTSGQFGPGAFHNPASEDAPGYMPNAGETMSRAHMPRPEQERVKPKPAHDATLEESLEANRQPSRRNNALDPNSTEPDALWRGTDRYDLARINPEVPDDWPSGVGRVSV